DPVPPYRQRRAAPGRPAEAILTMPHLELTLRCREADQQRYEAALEDVGAMAVTLLDAEAETPNERAILEPGVGETPLWAEITLNALFDHESDRDALLSALEAFDDGLDL